MQRVDDYSLANYGGMIADPVRMPAYAEALQQAVVPGAVVVDIGAGTGIFSLLAAQAGARRVYAIEPNDVVDTAREIAEANGFADRIVFFKDFSTEVELPEFADVIVSDLRGLLPLYTGNLASIIDARDRFLAPGGVLIPHRDVLWVGLIESREAYESIVGPPPERCFGLDMSAVFRGASSRGVAKTFEPSCLLSEPAPWASLEYSSLESSDAAGSLTLAPSRRGTLHGLVTWFETELIDGTGYSTGPGNATVHRSRFFALAEPVPVSPGDRVAIRLDAWCVRGA
jgi:type I protein arginine methyltransferase